MFEPHRELNTSKTYREKQGGKEGIEDSLVAVLGHGAHLASLSHVSLCTEMMCYSTRFEGKQGAAIDRRCLEPTHAAELQ